MKRSRWFWGIAGLAAVAALCVLYVQQTPSSSVGHQAVALSPWASHPAARPVAEAEATVPAERSSTEFTTWLAEESSLRGAQLDGDWGLDAQGKLHPSLALKRRFDQLLTLLGETTLAQLQQYIEAAVRAKAGPQAAAEVLAIWQRYVQLVGTAFQQAVDPRDWRTWQAALAEQHRVRHALLGPAWADAFYRDEERQLALQIQAAQANNESTPPASEPPLIRRADLTPQQNQKLQTAEADWDRWKIRVTEAKQAVAQLQTAPELSAPQREAAVNRWLAERFDANEQRRVRALIEAQEALP